MQSSRIKTRTFKFKRRRRPTQQHSTLNDNTQMKSKLIRSQYNCDLNPSMKYKCSRSAECILRPSAMILMLLLMILPAVPQVKAFCPRGCLCDDSLLRVSCQQLSSISIVPMTLNPALKSLRLNQVPISELGSSLTLYRQLNELDLTGNQLRSIRYENFNFKVAPHSIQLHANNQHPQQIYQNATENNVTLLKRHQEFVAKNLKSVIQSRIETSSSEEIGFHLRELYLANNRLEQLGNYQLIDHQLQLQQQYSTQMDNINDNDATATNLKGSQLEKLAPFLALTRLEILNLANNKLNRLHQHVFLGLIKLRELDLSGNELEFLDELAFVSLIELRSLKMNRNKLANQLVIIGKSLCRAPFKELNQLELADQEQSTRQQQTNRQHYQNLPPTSSLPDNVVILPNQMFFCAPNLVHLELSRLQLRYIQVQAFDNLLSLETLNLSGNPLEQVPSDSLRQLATIKSSLVNLDLSETLIEFVNANSFAQLQSLQLLAMNRMARLVRFDLSSFHFEARQFLANNRTQITQVPQANSYLSSFLQSQFSSHQSDLATRASQSSLVNRNLLQLQLSENPKLVSIHSSLPLLSADNVDNFSWGAKLVFEQLKWIDLAGNSALRELPLDNMLDWSGSNGLRRLNSQLEINLVSSSRSPMKLNCSSCKMSWLLETARKQFSGLPNERQIYLKNLDFVECLEPAEIGLIRLIELEASLHSSGTQARPLDCSDRDTLQTDLPSYFGQNQLQQQTFPSLSIGESQQADVLLNTNIGLVNQANAISQDPTNQEQSKTDTWNVMLILGSLCLLVALLLWLALNFLWVEPKRLAWLSLGSGQTLRKSSSPTFSQILASTSPKQQLQDQLNRNNNPAQAAYLAANDNHWEVGPQFALMLEQQQQRQQNAFHTSSVLVREPARVSPMGKWSSNLFSRFVGRFRCSASDRLSAPATVTDQSSRVTSAANYGHEQVLGPTMWLEQNNNAIAYSNHDPSTISPQLTTSSNSGSSTSMLVTRQQQQQQLIRSATLRLARGLDAPSNRPELLENYSDQNNILSGAKQVNDPGAKGREFNFNKLVERGNNELQRVNNITVRGNKQLKLQRAIISESHLRRHQGDYYASFSTDQRVADSLEALGNGADCLTSNRAVNADFCPRMSPPTATATETSKEIGSLREQFDGHIYVTLDRPIKQQERQEKHDSHLQFKCVKQQQQHELRFNAANASALSKNAWPIERSQTTMNGRNNEHEQAQQDVSSSTTNNAICKPIGPSSSPAPNDDHKSFEWSASMQSDTSKSGYDDEDAGAGAADFQFKLEKSTKINGLLSSQVTTTNTTKPICNGKSFAANVKQLAAIRHAPRTQNGTSSSFMMDSKGLVMEQERTNEYAPTYDRPDANHDSVRAQNYNNDDNDYVINGARSHDRLMSKAGELNYHSDNQLERVGGACKQNQQTRTRGDLITSQQSQQNATNNTNSMETTTATLCANSKTNLLASNATTMLFLLHNHEQGGNGKLNGTLAVDQAPNVAPQAASANHKNERSPPPTHHNRRQARQQHRGDQIYQPVKQTTTSAATSRQQEGIYANHYYYYSPNSAHNANGNNSEHIEQQPSGFQASERPR